MTLLQAIETKYIGPSNVKGSRIHAFCAAGSVYMYYRHEFDTPENHHLAACKLMKKLGWDEHSRILGGGSLKHGNYAWILTRKQEE
jgi:hypothetical protein